jgi:hypothetical protein
VQLIACEGGLERKRGEICRLVALGTLLASFCGMPATVVGGRHSAASIGPLRGVSKVSRSYWPVVGGVTLPSRERNDNDKNLGYSR